MEYNKADRKKTSRIKDKNGKVKKQVTVTEEECGYLCSWDSDHGHHNYGFNFFDDDVDFFSEAFSIHYKEVNHE